MTHRLETGLLIYSIVVTTVLLLTFGVSSPSWLSFLTVALLFPLVAYFWIRLTNPLSTNADVWSLRFMGVLGFLILAGVFSLQQARKNQALIDLAQPDSASQQTINDLQHQLDQALARSQNQSNISNDLSGIKKELIALKGQVESGTVESSSLAGLNALLQATLSASLRDIPLGYVQVRTGYPYTVRVLGEPINTAPEVAVMTPDTEYPYFSKQGSWYFVKMSETHKGWVESLEVEELSDI